MASLMTPDTNVAIWLFRGVLWMMPASFAVAIALAADRWTPDVPVEWVMSLPLLFLATAAWYYTRLINRRQEPFGPIFQGLKFFVLQLVIAPAVGGLFAAFIHHSGILA